MKLLWKTDHKSQILRLTLKIQELLILLLDNKKNYTLNNIF